MIHTTPGRPITAAAIAAPCRAACEVLARRELHHFLTLLDAVTPDEWTLPTACSRWNVRDVAAHQAAHIRSGSGLAGLLAQGNPLRARRFKSQGLTGNDATNELEVEMRREVPPEAIVREIREGTPSAIAARQRMGPASRLVRIPVPDYGIMTVDYLLHVVFPRDMWIHRLDVADATGRAFETSAGHDGLLLHHAVADMDRNVRKRLPGSSVLFTIEGPVGGSWRVGEGEEVRVTTDIETALRRMSGRISPAEALRTADVSANGEDTQRQVLDAMISIF